MSTPKYKRCTKLEWQKETKRYEEGSGGGGGVDKMEYIGENEKNRKRNIKVSSLMQSKNV